MKVHGFEIAAEQEQAALNAMAGTFTALQVQGAFERAGVPSDSTSMRAADRLLQRERKAGRIRAINNRTWQLVP